MRATLDLRSSYGDAVVLSELRRDNGNAAVLGNNNEINANDQKELATIIAAVIAECEKRKQPLISQQEAQERQERAKLHQQVMLAAFQSKEELARLGEHIAANLTIAVNRDGFMRRFLNLGDVNEGGIPQVRMDRKEVLANQVTTQVETNVSYVRGDTYYMDEFYVTAAPYIEQKELSRSPGNLLDETYTNALTSIMVKEDQLWKQMADELQGHANDQINISNSFLPVNFGAVIENVSQWGIPPMFTLMATDFWNDITSLEAWATLISLNAKEELLTSGRMGRIMGTELITDFHRHPAHKVINRGELYVVGSPETHGQYTDRNGVTSLELDAATQKVPGKGWFMSEQLSMIIVNDRSVAKLSRIGSVQGDNRALSTNIR